MFKRDSMAAAANREDSAETVITRTTNLVGTLKSDGTVKIYGAFDGSIETAGTLIVGKAGRVEANIIAQNVMVAGAVIGNITAARRVEIYSGGKVYGDISATALKIEDGGVFSGQSLMPRAEEDILLLERPRRLD